MNHGTLRWGCAGIAALLLAIGGLGCGEERQVVMVPVAPEPVAITLDELVARAQAGESEWTLIWAVRQSRRAWPLTTADIARLRDAGVSDRVINFMIETVTATRLYSALPVTIDEIVGLTKAGIPDEAIIREISHTNTIYRLTMTDVDALQREGVSNRVIDFMLYTRQIERPDPEWYVIPERF